MSASTLFREHELAFRTQYAELKERVNAAGSLLPGTPGTLASRMGTGYAYWYRVFYSVPGKQSEDLVCKDGDSKLKGSQIWGSRRKKPRRRGGNSRCFATRVSDLVNLKLGRFSLDTLVAMLLRAGKNVDLVVR